MVVVLLVVVVEALLVVIGFKLGVVVATTPDPNVELVVKVPEVDVAVEPGVELGAVELGVVVVGVLVLIVFVLLEKIVDLVVVVDVVGFEVVELPLTTPIFIVVQGVPAQSNK